MCMLEMVGKQKRHETKTDKGQQVTQQDTWNQNWSGASSWWNRNRELYFSRLLLTKQMFTSTVVPQVVYSTL